MSINTQTNFITGLIAGCYDIGSVLCSIPVSYLGSLPKASKPRWIGWGLAVMGLGSLVFALPHFASPSHHLTLVNQDATVDVLLCLKNVLSIVYLFTYILRIPT